MKHIADALKQLLARVSQSFTDAERRRREAYLAEASDLVDLELRQRELARPAGSFVRPDYFARG
ncbi:DUF3563 family protein [Burkholderia ubonensis]|nr:DUF3563 family protein [Burkholderia ubonensis]